MRWYDTVVNVTAVVVALISSFMGKDLALFLSAFGGGMISATFLSAALRGLEK